MIRVVVCPTCKGNGFHEVRRYGDTPDDAYICQTCLGERVVEEIVTQRPVICATLVRLRAQQPRV